MQKIIPHLWFDKEARQAAGFYTSVFDKAKINSVRTIHDTPSGDAESVHFQITGYEFMAISAGPYFQLNPSISFHARTRTIEEADRLWSKLSPGGKIMMALGEYPFSRRYGWVQDKFGVSWQIIPENMAELMAKNPEKTTPVMLGMKKIIIADMVKAGKT